MLTKKIIQGIIIAVITQFIGIKGVIEIIIEDVLCPICNEEYVTEPDVYIDANNRLFVNFSIIKQLPPDIQVEYHLIGSSMGKYLIQTGFDFEMSLCDMFNEPVILGPIVKLLGFVETDCPPSPGVYGTESYTIPIELMPDDFMPNKYLGILKFKHEDKELAVVHVYYNIL